MMQLTRKRIQTTALGGGFWTPMVIVRSWDHVMYPGYPCNFHIHKKQTLKNLARISDV